MTCMYRPINISECLRYFIKGLHCDLDDVVMADV